MPWISRRSAPTRRFLPAVLVKSIQYGGFFAGVEQGSFKKFASEPDLRVRRAERHPVANVASGQSQLGDRPIGPLIVGAGQGHSDQNYRHGVSEEPVQHHESRQDSIKTVAGHEGQDHRVSTSGKPLMLNRTSTRG